MWKSDAIARAEPMKVPINPNIGVSLNDIDKFVFIFLRMGI